VHWTHCDFCARIDNVAASNKKLKVSLTPTDILHDVLEPVQSMLMQRGGKVDVQVVCEEGLFALADRLRLNQVMLNLGRNSAKFVDEGYIRLSAKPFENGLIQLTVEDSGPGKFSQSDNFILMASFVYFLIVFKPLLLTQGFPKAKNACSSKSTKRV